MFINKNNVEPPQFSLAHLTLIGCSVAELTYIASRAGYDAISPRFLNIGVEEECPYDPLSKEMLQATKTALNLTGINVLDIELARIDEKFDIKKIEPMMMVGSELNAQYLITSVWLDNPDTNLIVDKYSELCDLAKQYQLMVNLEFPTFSSLKKLESAVEIVEKANRSNGGILIDVLYTQTAGDDLNKLSDLPTEWFPIIQVCDIIERPSDPTVMREIARNRRLYPGEGRVDFSVILDQLPNINFAIENPNQARVAELGHEEHARRSLQAIKSVIAEHQAIMV